MVVTTAMVIGSRMMHGTILMRQAVMQLQEISSGMTLGDKNQMNGSSMAVHPGSTARLGTMMIHPGMMVRIGDMMIDGGETPGAGMTGIRVVAGL